MNRHISWFKFPATPSTLYLLDRIPSKTFTIIWIKIVVGSNSQQNLQPYICWIQLQAKYSTSLDQFPSKTFNMCWITFQAKPSTLYESTYLSDQIPCKSFNMIFVGSHSQQHLQYWLDRIPSKTFNIIRILYESMYLLYQNPSRSFNLIWIDIFVGSNSKQHLEQYMNQHIC